MTDETNVPDWEIKLHKQFTWENNHAVWKDRDSAEAVVAFVKEELNGPIELYKKQLFEMVINQIKVTLAMAEDDILRDSFKELIKELQLAE